MVAPSAAAASPSTAAYYRLIGDQFEWSGTALHTVLGRSHAVPPSSFFSLGTSKTVSRLHLALTFSPSSSTWCCVIMGKNAVQVDGESYKRSALMGGGAGGGGELRVPLAGNRATPIKVGDVKFWFCPAIAVK